jgi:hypothetical protein
MRSLRSHEANPDGLMASPERQNLDDDGPCHEES